VQIKTSKSEPIESRLRWEPTINPQGKSIQNIKPENNTTFFQYNFDNVFNFLDALDINKSELFENEKIKFIFRGHKESDYLLLPSVFRDIPASEVAKLSGGNSFQEREIPVFKRFIEGINHLGLHIENESFQLINSNLSINTIENFPSEKQLKELALAQHYGVHTRLLDFSNNPLKSLFFACEKISKISTSDVNKKIGLWIIPERLIELVSEERYLEKIFIPGFQNKNMLAQEGLFINYFKGSGRNREVFNNGTIKTLDEYLFDKNLSKDLMTLITERIGKPMLFTLPYNEVPELNKKLESLNINWCTIQPDLEGVRKYCERKNY